MREHVIFIANVQRRATRILGEIRENNYPERLKLLMFLRLDYRWMRGRMTQIYKILTEKYAQTIVVPKQAKHL